MAEEGGPARETRACPYCAEEILVAARKCKHCGEFLDEKPAKTLDRPVTWVRITHEGRLSYLESDGSPAALFDTLVAAIKASKLILNDANRDSLMIKAESAGMTFQSFAGDDLTFSIEPSGTGSRATAQAKGKPSGLARVSWKSNAYKHVQHLEPHLPRG